MTVYADIAFLFNFAMDLLALTAAAKLMRLHPSVKRLCAVSALAALYGTGVYLLPSWLFSWPVKLLFSLLLTRLTFVPAGKAALLRAWGFTVLANAILGGLAEMAFALGGGYAPTVPFKWVCATALLALPAYCLGTRLRPTRSHISLVVAFEEGTCRFDAVIDSGCLLIHPETCLPVVIIPADRLPFSPATPLSVPYATVNDQGQLPALLPLYACVGGRSVHICVALSRENVPAVVPTCLVSEI